MSKALFPEDYFVALEDFQPKPEIRVCIPQKPFRIDVDHPRHCYLLWTDRQWHMVFPEVAEACNFRGIQKASLYKGVFDNGEPFLLPVTHSEPNQNQSWYEGWMDIVELAQEHWVTVTKNQRRRRFLPQIVKCRDEPEWPPFTIDDCVRLAFSKGQIDSIDHPLLQDRDSNRRSASYHTFDEGFEE